MTPTFASLFGGGGGADIGAQQAGFRCLWSVEMDPALACWHERNVGGECIPARVQDVDPGKLARPDVLWASPVCKEFSVANSGRTEGEEERTQAEAVVRFIRVLRPGAFCMENVGPYQRSKSYAAIISALRELGYSVHAEVVNAASFGVAQTRKRLIVRAVQQGPVPALWPTHTDPKRIVAGDNLFGGGAAQVPWIGWYAVIEDLIPTLPASRFADWQLKRLPEEIGGALLLEGTGHWPAQELRRGPSDEECRVTQRGEDEPATTLKGAGNGLRAFLCHGTSTMELRESEEPSTAVMATVGTKAVMPRAFLVSDQTLSGGEGVQVRDEAEPATTIRALSGGGSSPRAFLIDPCQSNPDRGPITRDAADPSLTVQASQGAAKYRAFLVDCVARTDADLTTCEPEEPAFTVKSSHSRRPVNEPKAFLVEGDAAGERCPTLRDGGEPAFTMKAAEGGRQQRAFLVDGKPADFAGALRIEASAKDSPTLTASQPQHPFRAWLVNGDNASRDCTLRDASAPTLNVGAGGDKSPIRAWLDRGRVVAMTTRALARFQSFPDSYELPDNKKLATTIIGNAVPPLLAQRVLESLKGSL